MTRVPGLVAAALLLTVTGAGADYFDRIEVGARGIGLAGAYGADVRDVTAAYWNPGALSFLDRPEVVFTHGRPYVVNELAANSIAAGFEFAGGGLAATWHRLGVDGVVAEDMIALAYGRRLTGNGSRTIHAGLAAKLAMVSFNPTAGSRDFGSKSGFTGDLGLLWQEGRAVSLGLVWRNVLQPTYDFVGDDGGATLPTGFEISGSYRWRKELGVLMDVTTVGGETIWNYAGELWFYDVFALRAGVRDTEFAGGIGVRGTTWEVDVSFITNKVLGNSYYASVQFFIPSPGGEP